MLYQVIFCSLIGGLFSLLGGIILAFTNKGRSFASYATAFAAGALLAAAFVDMLPEALKSGGEPQEIMFYAMGGLVVFFLLEGVINWFHRHNQGGDKIHPVVPMIVLGDTLHNFIDGVAIAAGFLISPVSGLIVTLAVAAHEIPQEIGDFAIMLDKGVKRWKALLINGLSALATTLSAVIFFILGESQDISLVPLIAVVAGFFIYIATTDIIPTIHSSKNRKEIWQKMIWLIVGLVAVSFIIVQLHAVIDQHSGHQHSHDSSLEAIEHEHTHGED
jgi:zinc and cadmium transporter